MSKTWMIVLGVVVVLALWVGVSYNSLVRANQAADSQWANVETQYQRRFDLIPNLVNSVKGILTQEQKVFGDIDAARAQYSGATTPEQKAEAANNVEGSLGRLIAIVENYPTLASSQNVADLMSQLEGTENRISVERSRYNTMVQSYNNSRMTFPTNIIASIFGFGQRTYFEAAAGAETAPTVNLQ